jgi:hypothetical protein
VLENFEKGETETEDNTSSNGIEGEFPGGIHRLLGLVEKYCGKERGQEKDG